MGAAIAALGLMVRAVASGHVDKNEELAMTGPYAYVRNPLYLGSIVVAIGFAVAARDLMIAAIIVLLFAVIYVPTIRSEEEYLRKHFTEYVAYAQEVPRLLPRRLRFGGMTQDFSRELYRKHREYNAIIRRRGNAGGACGKDPLVPWMISTLQRPISILLLLLLSPVFGMRAATGSAAETQSVHVAAAQQATIGAAAHIQPLRAGFAFPTQMLAL